MFGSISKAIKGFFSNSDKENKVEQSLDSLEEELIMSDMPVDLIAEIIKSVKGKKLKSEIEVEEFIASQIQSILKKCDGFLELARNSSGSAKVILVSGVNGSGKTTTIGKLAIKATNNGKKVCVICCDTFRAAAAEQLQVWSRRAGCDIMMPNFDGEDPAAVAFRGLTYALGIGCDIVFIDTAGRLQNNTNLMDQVKKIGNVIKKIDPTAPHESIIVLDGTTGKNSINQFEVFDKALALSGAIVTKLDSSAKGGVIVSIARKFRRPIYMIGTGEGEGDLEDFNYEKFSKQLLQS